MTAVVEPNIGVKKTDGTGGAAVAPGAAVSYTIVVSNPKNGAKTSTAHQVVATDTLPAGLTYVVGSAVRCRRRSQGRFSPGFCPTSPPGRPRHHPQGRDPNPIIGRRPSSTPPPSPRRASTPPPGRAHECQPARRHHHRVLGQLE